MKNKNGIYIIGIDHGYGNIKTANCCFPTGVESSDTEPTFKNDLLIYQGRYYQIGVGHKEYAAEKVMDEDYYILTLAAIARELSREQITQGNVFLAAGLPLSWVTKQRKAFQAYLLQKSEVEFTFRRKNYRRATENSYGAHPKVLSKELHAKSNRGGCSKTLRE